ncbi:MAG: DNA primase [Saprospiraceae bacterium]|nr:DNA primase [Saprospiraceae bacterium]
MILRKSIDAVVETARIEDVARDYVDLKPRGSNLIGLCPFHKEKTPSFYVSASKNIYKCFGCGKGGNPVQFLMEVEQLTFPEAIRQLAKKYQIQLEETQRTEENIAEEKELESLHIINQLALEHFKSNLWTNPIGRSVALSYLKQRGYSESTIEKFDLGFALDDVDDLLQFAMQKGYKAEFLQKLGLANQNNRDFFRNRLIFPIHNSTGKPIAFAGRIFSSDSKVAKYINSPETELYQKSKTLYGLHLAKKSIRDKNQCILVEGYTDVISLSQAGIENVVASSGTSLTEEQIQAIKRITPNIMILYDGDPAGIKAATRGVDLILRENMNVKIAVIPDNEDPDGYIQKQGSTAFEQFLTQNAVDFILFKLNSQIQEIQNDPVKKSTAIHDIIRSISMIPDSIKRSIYIKETAAITKVDEQSLIETCNKLLHEQQKQKSFQEKRIALDRDEQILKELSSKETVQGKAQTFIAGSDEFQEKDICRILILYGHLWYEETQGISYASYIIENIADTLPFFDNEIYKSLILDISGLLSDGELPDLNYYLNHTNKTFAELALDFSFNKYDYSSNWSEKLGIFLHTQNEPDLNFASDVTQSILRFKLKKYNKAITDFESKIKSSELSEEELEIELKSHQYIIQQRNYIAGLLRTVIIQ